MGLVALTATGIASMVGAGITIIPFMIQRNVPGIGTWVLPAFLFAAVPAFFAGLAYAILASAMPRAGGSYVYASRALNPYLGFIASFCVSNFQTQEVVKSMYCGIIHTHGKGKLSSGLQ